MRMIPCRSCGTRMAASAEACPSCGAPARHVLVGRLVNALLSAGMLGLGLYVLANIIPG